MCIRDRSATNQVWLFFSWCNFSARLLTHEIGNWFFGFVLSHEEAHSLLFLVSEQLCIANAALFPLIVSEPVQLDTEFHDALESLFTSGSLHQGKVNLDFNQSISPKHGIPQDWTKSAWFRWLEVSIIRVSHLQVLQSLSRHTGHHVSSLLGLRLHASDSLLSAVQPW